MKSFGMFVFDDPLRDRYTFGWLTGEDKDLVCVKPITANHFAEKALSPVCTNRIYAVLGFILKRILVSIDRNISR
ncbi:hypothetical protein IID62_10965 [candidate division KSB1 bacterium]|nr:hypothetical protein [candidate division KSB1 bacterium]